jgi:hypothetical protein
LNKRSADLEENPNNIKDGLPVDTIISNTMIIASQRLSERRSKPPKANSCKRRLKR